MDNENKYVKRAKRVEERVNNYSQSAESLILNSIDLIHDFLIELSSKPKNIDDIINHNIGRILDLFDIKNELVDRWNG